MVKEEPEDPDPPVRYPSGLSPSLRGIREQWASTHERPRWFRERFDELKAELQRLMDDSGQDKNVEEEIIEGGEEVVDEEEDEQGEDELDEQDDDQDEEMPAEMENAQDDYGEYENDEAPGVAALDESAELHVPQRVQSQMDLSAGAYSQSPSSRPASVGLGMGMEAPARVPRTTSTASFSHLSPTSGFQGSPDLEVPSAASPTPPARVGELEYSPPMQVPDDGSQQFTEEEMRRITELRNKRDDFEREIATRSVALRSAKAPGLVRRLQDEIALSQKGLAACTQELEQLLAGRTPQL